MHSPPASVNVSLKDLFVWFSVKTLYAPSLKTSGQKAQKENLSWKSRFWLMVVKAWESELSLK